MALPLFIGGAILTQIDFGVLWRYFGVANQATAALMLWTAAAYMLRHNKLHWICTIPALFMTTVVVTYILNSSDLGLDLPMRLSTIAGVLTALLILSAVWKRVKAGSWITKTSPSLENSPYSALLSETQIAQGFQFLRYFFWFGSR